MKINIEIYILIFFFFFSLFLFLSLAPNNNSLVISLEKNSVSCQYNLNFSFSSSFIDLLYFNNQAEVTYNIILIKTTSTGFITQNQKILEKKIQYFLSFKNESKVFTLFSKTEYIETNSIKKIEEMINKIKFENIFSLDKAGYYYCVSNVYITSLVPISPALLILFLFYNPYNMKILNLESNLIQYESQK